MKFDFEGDLKQKDILEQAFINIEPEETVKQILYCKMSQARENAKYIIKTENQICKVVVSPEGDDESQIIDIKQWRLKDINSVNRQMAYHRERKMFYTRSIEIFFDNGEELIIRMNDFSTVKNEDYAIEFLDSIRLGV